MLLSSQQHSEYAQEPFYGFPECKVMRADDVLLQRALIILIP